MPSGTTVTLREYARALAGMPQPLAGMLKSRVVAAAKLGPPKGPVALRVSAIRHSVTATKRRACGPGMTIVVGLLALAVAAPPPDTDTEFDSGVPAFAATFTVTVIGS